MRELILYLILFLIVYLFYLIFVLNRKNMLIKFKDSKEIRYLKSKYNIKVKDEKLKSIANKVFLANSFILSTTVEIICLIDNLFIGIIVSALIMIVLIIVIYSIIGNYYKKRG